MSPAEDLYQLSEIDRTKTLLPQWGDKIVGAKPPAAEWTENRHIARALAGQAAQQEVTMIAGLITGRTYLEQYLQDHIENAEVITHFTMAGVWEDAARCALNEAWNNAPHDSEEVTSEVVADSSCEDLYGMVVMNMLVGQLSKDGDMSQIDLALKMSWQLLDRKRGELYVVSRNARGGCMEAYNIVTPPDQIEEGNTFTYEMEGYGEIIDTHFTRRGLAEVFGDNGLFHQRTIPVRDSRHVLKPAYYIDIYKPE